MGMKTAFLNGEVGEEVYVSQSPGFVDGRRSFKVLQMHKVSLLELGTLSWIAYCYRWVSLGAS